MKQPDAILKDGTILDIKTIPPRQNPVMKVFPESAAKKLADLYLPVHLRDFFLGMAPIIQFHLYNTAGSPEEFFSLILMEHARFHNDTMNSGRKTWSSDPRVRQFYDFDIQATEVEIKQITSTKLLENKS